MSSIERRLARFIANERIVVPLIWKRFLAQVLAPFHGQQLHFVLDNTPFRDELTIVYLGLLVHSRVLPVAWAVMPAQTKWDEGQWQIVGRLLEQVRVHLPDSSCTLIADRGLAGMPLVKLCTACGWHYLLRICAEHTCRRFFNGKLEHSWKRLSTIVRHRVAIIGMAEPGSGKRRRSKRTSVWCGTTSMRNRGYSSVIREQDTDRSRLMPGACAWKRRFKIAKVVAGTSKPVGLKIEHTRDSLAAGALSGYVVDLASGRSLYPSRTTAARMTRVDRRDKSIFRLGRLWLLDILRRVHNRASLRHCLPFQKTNMGWRFALHF